MSQTFTEVPDREFSCSRCKKPAHWTNNPFRPFCSERCKMIDLGAWANEDYRVPENEAHQSTNDQNTDFEED